ncbi:hypothetical protein GGI05_000240 [Coemansia sp. RSA 2603]|nr:hypothetical protein GGI05_000240 [Coemansia sp. RSA 2603]
MSNFEKANSTDGSGSEIIFNQPDDVDMSGKLMVGGNIFEKQASVTSTSSSRQSDISTNSDSESDFGSDSELVSSSDATANENNGSSGLGLDKTAKVVIGVVVPVAVIIIAICAFVGYRLLKNRHNNSKTRAHAEEMHLREMANELVVDNSVQPAALNPPPYSADTVNDQLRSRQSAMTTASFMSNIPNSTLASAEAVAQDNQSTYEFTDKK